MSEKKRVLLGRIVAAHGLKGEVKIQTYTGQPEDIAAYGPLSDATRSREIKIASLRAGQGGTAVARLAGVEDRRAAESLKGVDLYVERRQLPEAKEDEWYHSDLIGLQAVTPEGKVLGEVSAMQNFGGGDLIEIQPIIPGKALLIPFTAKCVPQIDVEGGKMIMIPPKDPDDAGSV